MITFLTHYPFRYYLKTFWRKGSVQNGVLLLRRENSSILSPLNNHLHYEGNLQKYDDAIALNRMSNDPQGSFETQVLRKRFGSKEIAWAVLTESPRYHIELQNTEDATNAQELRSLNKIQSVHSVEQDEYEWEYLNDNLGSIDKEVTPFTLLVGIPKDEHKAIENWTRSRGDRLNIILPAPLVSLDLSRTHFPTAIHLYATRTHTHVAATLAGRIKAYFTLNPIDKTEPGYFAESITPAMNAIDAQETPTESVPVILQSADFDWIKLEQISRAFAEVLPLTAANEHTYPLPSQNKFQRDMEIETLEPHLLHHTYQAITHR